MRGKTFGPYGWMLGLQCVTLVACSEDFTSKTQLETARILAVRAEPPEPVQGESAVLRPLVYLPATEPSVTYAWSWCPLPSLASTGFTCPIDQAGLDRLAGNSGLTAVPPLDLGTGETATFTNPFPPSLLAALCAGDSATMSALFGSQASHGEGHLIDCTVATFPVQVKVMIVGKTRDVGVFTLHLPVDGSTPANQNPMLAGLAAKVGDSFLALDETGTIVLPRKQEVMLQANLEESAAENFFDKQVLPNGEYQRDENGQFILGPARERLLVSWFSEAGSWENGETGFLPTAKDDRGVPIPLQVARENSWKTPLKENYVHDFARIVVVVRDSRGGVTWTQALVGLEGAP